MRILLVTSPHPEASWLHKALQESGHSVPRADDLRDGLFLASQEAFDAIVATAFEPGSDAALIAMLPRFVADGGGAALVVLIGDASARERIHMLRAGADACFCAPYSFIELHERLQALQRLAGPREAGRSIAGVSAVETLARELADGKLRLAVTRREFLLLECLMRHPNVPVPRDQLIRYVWQDKEDVDPSSVNLVVSRLRRKLARHLPDVRIDTVSRYGYQVTLPDA
ncbi:response regulator transcription factor [Burkholderia cenocepacia]|uniref:Two component transcriptional regulator, winged helix family n=1 Tax=Burkholderia orbicola (strain MC0-3) TaxID=406425 RepID=B1K2Y3_BURO0|nr:MULTISPECIES: response regulator transcription factor [Burkholderia cepacia complex]ACA94803.1 two component transcriptional regulator, winged helix family [Burkholderia orbicola MC0-3]AQQ30469.1 DNA-binding response regulator [Burkholderia cenocepacia]AQT53033.1 transcriptional regulator [Burkholderia cenocepacia]ELW9448085.1 response regulator transcription factor [Burkholderia cenocepacia]MBR8089732.1 response regulator transcription factor [Burkholderia cenocepacia]